MKVWVIGYVALSAIMLAVGFALTDLLDGSVGRWDASVNRSFAAHRTDLWNSITGTATWFVNTLPAVVIAAVIVSILLLAKRWREAAMLFMALALELAVFLSVTFVVARPRPDVVRLNATPSTGSFPSGHTAAATVLLAGTAIIVMCCTRNTAARVLAVLFAIAVAILVGFARVYRGLHYPSDVISGALLGLGCLIVAVLAVRATAGRPATAPRKTGETELRDARVPAA